MASSIFVTATDSVRLEESPISRDCILAGAPEARSTMLARSQDRTSHIMAWECTAGEFVWHYAEDETIVVISGEAFVTDEAGMERRLAEGHVALFPAGSSSRWRVTRTIKKIAMLRKDLPPPLGIGVRAWHKLLRVAGLRGGSSLMPAAAGEEPAANMIGAGGGS